MSDELLVGIVIASHSPRIAEGTVELAREMAGEDVRIVGVGGTIDGRLGSDAAQIAQAIQEADAGAGVVVLADVGSSVLATQTAIGFLDAELAERVRLSGGPIVEGAVIASVQASVGDPVDDVLKAAEDAAAIDKHVR